MHRTDFNLYLRHFSSMVLPMLLLLSVVPVFAADGAKPLAATPPMGWNDWAHYQCGFTGQTILENAQALVKTGLAARGYNTVTIDDCWMLKTRDARGDLQVDPQRFPQGMKPLADAIHALGLKFGIYEDSGSTTCGGYAGSGVPQGGGADHFTEDARLFVSWGVDYLKLDGCNLYIPKDDSKLAVYRKVYATQHRALEAVGRPITFSESAPAYFEGTPEWYDSLTWVRSYGQLWREGTDMANFSTRSPDRPRFQSVLWNYAYNLPLGSFQKPGNWNDPDFIIGGDGGMSAAESRSQVALWSMMSAPLILSSDVGTLSPEAVAILGNQAVIAVDQDALGKMATLVRRTAAMDVLLKPLRGGEYAVAVLNRDAATAQVALRPAELGFAASSACKLDARDLWSGAHLAAAATLSAEVAAHDTAIWRIHPAAACGAAARTGTVTINIPSAHHDIDSYSRCLAAPGQMEACTGGAAESWTVTAGGALKSGGRCLAVVDGRPALQACTDSKAQHWSYTLPGNLVSGVGGLCLSGDAKQSGLAVEVCGHNEPSQIWSLPN